MVKEFRASHKKIYDPVHGFIKFDDEEKELIDSFAFQRLHYIHQLGVSYMVFPGATHTRFEHSLGVMELATMIYKKLCKGVRPDLFNFLPRTGSSIYIYWKKVIRLAALCHDLGHLPFSHVAEKDFLKPYGHEKWTLKIIKSHAMEPIWKKINSELLDNSLSSVDELIRDIVKLAIGEKVLQKIDPDNDYQFDTWHRILSEIINGDFFGADRIDYLLRDAKFTGVVYGLFDYLQLIESLKIIPVGEGEDNFRLGIDENGIESCEALLLARHFMYRRVYQNSTVRSYNFHLKRFMLEMYSDLDILKDVNKFLSQNDISVLNELILATKDKEHRGHEDAKRIINRKDRFKAIPLSDKISERDLIKFKNKYNIDPKNIAWEISQDKEELDLSFPVVKYHMTVTSAKESSLLLTTIPSIVSNWVYVAPEYEISILKFLENIS
jgi:uncharacterized protein